MQRSLLIHLSLRYYLNNILLSPSMPEDEFRMIEAGNLMRSSHFNGCLPQQVLNPGSLSWATILVKLTITFLSLVIFSIRTLRKLYAWIIIHVQQNDMIRSDIWSYWVSGKTTAPSRWFTGARPMNIPGWYSASHSPLITLLPCSSPHSESPYRLVSRCYSLSGCINSIGFTCKRLNSRSAFTVTLGSPVP